MAYRPDLRRSHTDHPSLVPDSSWPATESAAERKDAAVDAWRMTVQEGSPRSELHSSFPATPAVLEAQVSEPLYSDLAYRISARRALNKSSTRPQTADGLPRRPRLASSVPTTPPLAKRNGGYFALRAASPAESPLTPPSEPPSPVLSAWTPSPPSDFKLALRTVKVKVLSGDDVFAFRMPLTARLNDVNAALDARGVSTVDGFSLHIVRGAAWAGGHEPQPIAEDVEFRASLRAASKASDCLRLVAV